ncbi:MAG: hypothetical protein QXQ81_10385, partial [Candidatus Thorarchaeota archaeon]
MGLVTPSVMAAQMLPDDTLLPVPSPPYELDEIYILFDPNDDILVSVAEAVREILSYRLGGVSTHPVRSSGDLEAFLVDAPWIAIYALRSDVQGIQFSDRKMSWMDFYLTIREYSATQHVVGTGNTLSLQKYLSTRDLNIWHAESEQTDGLLLILYDVWTTADIIDTRAGSDPVYDRAGKDIRAMALKLYCDNLREFLYRTLEPVDPVGEVDPVALEERTREMWERHAPTIRPAAYRLVGDSLQEVPIDSLPADFEPGIKLVSPAELTADDYVLGEIPLLSGLNGPIGDIIDILLDVLIDEGKTTLAIPSDIVDSIVEAFEVIRPFLGLVNDFDSDSALKAVVLALSDQFPFIAEYKPYLEILLKALFNLRGDLSSILEVVTEIVIALLPEIVPESVKTFLTDLIGIGTELWDMISQAMSEGKGVYDLIFGFITKNSLTRVIQTVLADKIGVVSPQLVDRITKFVTATVNFLTTRDYARFLTEVGNDLLSSLLPLTGLQPAIDKIMAVVKMAMTAVSLVDQYDAASMVQLVSDLVTTFAPTGLVKSSEAFARELLGVVKTYMENGLTDLAAFKSEIMAIIDSAVSSTVPTSTRTLIRDAITLISGFYNEGFDKNQLPDIFELATAIIQALNLPPTQMGYQLAQETEFINAMNNVVRPVLGIVASITESDSLKCLIAKTVSRFETQLGSLPN